MLTARARRGVAITTRQASSIGRLFSPPEFKLVPIDENTWKRTMIALAWNAARSHQLLPELGAVVERIATELIPGGAAGETGECECR